MHATVVLQDHLFSNLLYSEWKHTLNAKVQGSVNLHEVASEINLVLDSFIITSSFKAIMALRTQAAYCAAKCFQDVSTRYRRSLGLPSYAIAFRLITEIGETGQREDASDDLSQQFVQDRQTRIPALIRRRFLVASLPGSRVPSI